MRVFFKPERTTNRIIAISQGEKSGGQMAGIDYDILRISPRPAP